MKYKLSYSLSFFISSIYYDIDSKITLILYRSCTMAMCLYYLSHDNASKPASTSLLIWYFILVTQCCTAWRFFTIVVKVSFIKHYRCCNAGFLDQSEHPGHKASPAPSWCHCFMNEMWYFPVHVQGNEAVHCDVIL